MRRSDKEVTDREEVEELLSNALVGRLGTCFDNIPYITPVNFVYDKDKIYFHSAHEGRKIDNIKYNQQVCFEIDEIISIIPGRRMPCGSTTEYKSVIIFGDIRVVIDIDEKTSALNKLIGKYAPEAPRLPQSTDAANRTNVLVIDVKKMTAKQSPVGRKTVVTPSEK